MEKLQLLHVDQAGRPSIPIELQGLKYFKYFQRDRSSYYGDAPTPFLPFLISPTTMEIGRTITQFGIYIEIGTTGFNKPFLKVDPREGEIITKSRKYTNPILTSIRNEGNIFILTKLTILCCHVEVNIELIPKTIRHLKLEHVVLLNGTIGLQSLEQLESLHIYTDTPTSLMFSDLSSGILELTLKGSIKLTYSSDTIPLDKLKSIRIDDETELDSEILGKFGEIFPNLEMLFIGRYSSGIMEQLFTRLKGMKTVVICVSRFYYEFKFQAGIEIIGECHEDALCCKLEKNITTNGWNLTEINKVTEYFYQLMVYL